MFELNIGVHPKLENKNIIHQTAIFTDCYQLETSDWRRQQETSMLTILSVSEQEEREVYTLLQLEPAKQDALRKQFMQQDAAQKNLLVKAR